VVPGLLLAAQDTLQARGYHGHGHGSAVREWELFFERHTVQAALIGLGISLLAGLLGVGREDTGAEAGQGSPLFRRLRGSVHRAARGHGDLSRPVLIVALITLMCFIRSEWVEKLDLGLLKHPARGFGPISAP
jgi:hypothetical protein